MKMNQDKQLDLLIDQALREFPLEPAPVLLQAKILERIEKPLAAPRFRISWVDFALSGALALIFGFAMDFIQGAAHSPYWSARFRIELSLFWRDIRYFLVHNQTSLVAVLLSVVVVSSLLAVLASVYRRYAVNSRGMPA